MGDNKEMTLEGLSGGAKGSDFNGGKNSNSSTKSKNKEAKEYFARKFSTGIPLAEQIMKGGRSWFLQIIDGKPKLSLFIDLSKQKGMILKPNQTVGSASPIIEYEYNDLREIEYFIDRASRMKIDDLYFLVKSIFKDVVATNEKELIVLLATDTIMTFFQDLFVTTHYVLFTGPPGWGKGAILTTLKILGYRVVLAGDMSGANLLDLLGPIEKCQVTLCEDEFDNIHDDPDKERIYKMGYEDIGSVTRTVDPSSSDRKLLYYNPYCIKFFASEKGPDTKSLGGFNDRLFGSEVKRGNPRRLIKEIKNQMERTPDKQLPKYRTIISRINFLRKVLLVYRLLHHDDTIEEVPLNITGRALELCGPAIRLFNSGQLAAPDRKALNEIMPALSHFLRKKGQLDKKVKEVVILDVLLDIFEQMDKEETAPGTSTFLNAESYSKRTTENNLNGKRETFYVISHDEICSRVMQEMEGNLISQRTFESAEYGRVSHDSLLATCRSLYSAKSDRITRDNNKNKRVRALSFNKDTVIEAGKNFEVVSEIKVLTEEEEEKQGAENSEDKARWDEWTNGHHHHHHHHSSDGTKVQIFRQNGDNGQEEEEEEEDADLDDSQNERANTEKTTTSEKDINDNSKEDDNEGGTNIESRTRIDDKFVPLYLQDSNHAQNVVKSYGTNFEPESEPESAADSSLANVSEYLKNPKKPGEQA